ncbi:MAG: hypothetical protein NVSMB18_12450 [Acetobacteraceae bacterium]
MLGRAVATMVWSTEARNIGRQIEGKTLRKRFRVSGGGAGRMMVAGRDVAGWAVAGRESAGGIRASQKVSVGYAACKALAIPGWVRS